MPNNISNMEDTSSTVRISSKTSRCDSDVKDFLENQNGYIIILSDDALFVKTVRTGVMRALGVKLNCVEAVKDVEQAGRSLREHLYLGMPVLIIVDRILAGRSTSDFIRTTKSIFPQAKLIAMTYETTKESLSLLYEIGVDHIITKPVSVDTLIEKMAGIIKPQSRISNLVQEARICLEQREIDKVFTLCDELLKIKQRCAAAHMLRGEAFMLKGTRDKAIAEFEIAHKYSPLYLEPLKRLVEVYRENNEEAYLSYMTILDYISPLNVERKYEIGKCYARKKDMDSAKKYFDEAITCEQCEAAKRLCTIISDIASSVMEFSPDIAAKYFEQYFAAKGENLSKDDLVTFNRFGITLRKQGKVREAIENYKKALHIDAEDTTILYNYGLACVDGEQFKTAIECYEKALSLEPSFHKQAAVVCNNMAYAYIMVKNNARAREFLATALEIDPQNASSQKLMERLK
ncbi:MAG TPA: tetratricopeptide repeat protein [Humidesulfovibrio sp.]|uniref:tetratricopeptide repeat protein n=1 Tax=Humidesulfovibrio sp. TaxID=2910988 RepID=UPI002C09BD80|nr:tetratricopeptide repeat protein [Humidesulfovibrio sp.]HWR03237.1 tetratricopeptide repeat protein [Humidesulfovibrio sp.]